MQRLASVRADHATPEGTPSSATRLAPGVRLHLLIVLPPSGAHWRSSRNSRPDYCRLGGGATERLGRRRVHARAPATADTDEAFLTTSASGRRPSHFGGFSLCYFCPRGQLRCPCVCIYGASLVYAPRCADADEKNKVPATPFE